MMADSTLLLTDAEKFDLYFAVAPAQLLLQQQTISSSANTAEQTSNNREPCKAFLENSAYGEFQVNVLDYMEIGGSGGQRGCKNYVSMSKQHGIRQSVYALDADYQFISDTMFF